MFSSLGEPVPSEGLLHVRDMVFDAARQRLFVAGDPGLWELDTSTDPIHPAVLRDEVPPDRDVTQLALDGDTLITLDGSGMVSWLSLNGCVDSALVPEGAPVVDVAPGYLLREGEGAAVVAGPDGGVFVLMDGRVDQRDAQREVVAHRDLPEAAAGALDLAWDEQTGALVVAAGSQGTFVFWPDGRTATLPTTASAARVQAGGGRAVVSDLDGVSIVALDEGELRVIGHIVTPSFAIASALDADNGRLFIGDLDRLLSADVDLDGVPPVAVVPSFTDPDGAVTVLNVGGSDLEVATVGGDVSYVPPGGATTLTPVDGCVRTSDPDRGATFVSEPGAQTAFPVGAAAPDVTVYDTERAANVSLAASTWASDEPPLATLIVFWASW